MQHLQFRAGVLAAKYTIVLFTVFYIVFGASVVLRSSLCFLFALVSSAKYTIVLLTVFYIVFGASVVLRSSLCFLFALVSSAPHQGAPLCALSAIVLGT